MASSSPSFFSAPQMHPPRDQETHRALLQDLRVTTTGKRAMPFSGIDNGEDELSDDSMQAGERKRRSLSKEQVRTLETSFEQGNKLEPEKKMQLAMALGLRPRQVAIWFQNRRARWKTKQLEKDYDALRRQLEAIKLENEALRAHNEKLQAEILALKGRYYNTSEPINLNKEIEASCSNPSENSSERTSMAMESSSFHPHRGLALLSSIRPAEMEMHCPKIEHYIAEGSFSNLLCSLEDHAATLWPWPDQHSFH